MPLPSPELKEWLEVAAFSAAVFTAGVAIVALKQVRAAIGQAKSALKQTELLMEQVRISTHHLELSRQDMILRSKREALALALEQCKRFAEHLIPHMSAVIDEMVQNGYKFPARIDKSFPFINEKEDPLAHQIWRQAPMPKKIIDALNEFESFAMYFANDLADEAVAFVPTANTFCRNCEWMATFIGLYRQDHQIKHYQNLVKLYGMWQPRLERSVLEEQGRALEEKKKKLPPDNPRAPLGTERN